MTLSWKWVEENKWKTSRVHFLFDRFEKYKAKALIHDTPGEHRATHIFQKNKKNVPGGESNGAGAHTHTHKKKKAHRHKSILFSNGKTWRGWVCCYFKEILKTKENLYYYYYFQKTFQNKIKQSEGGGEPRKARVLRPPFFSFFPPFSLVVCCVSTSFLSLSLSLPAFK